MGISLTASVRARLLSLVICVSVPCAVATLWAVGSAYKREQTTIAQSLRETTRALSSAVSRQLGTAEAVARTLSVSTDLANNRLDLFYEHAKRATAVEGGWAGLLDAGGTVLNTSVPWGTKFPPGRLLEVHAGIGRADVSPLFDARLAGQRAVAVSVTTTVGTTVYDVSVAMPPGRIQQVLDDQKLPPGWIATVVDQKGIVVARVPNAERWAGGPTTSKMRELLEKGGAEGTTRSVSMEGIPTTAFYSRIGESKWMLVMAVPDDVLRQDAFTTLAKSFMVALVLIVLALGLAHVISRKLAAPALALQQVARALENHEPVVYTPQGVTEFDIAGAAMASAGKRLAGTNDELQARVDEAITVARSTQQKVEAAQRQEALKRLTGGVAHDVNNLLAVISTSITLLERRPDDSQREKRLNAIRRAVTSGRELTQKLLSYSRQRTLDASLLDLREWLPDQIPKLQAALGPDSVIELRLDSGTDLIKVDASELLVALINLTTNAAHAMGPSGRLSIEVGNHVIEEQSPKVKLIVADNGPGVPAELLTRIFEPFFTTGEVIGRAGLGLSQVQSFCELSNGLISVENRERGAAFAIALPSAGSVADEHLAAVVRDRPNVVYLLYVEDNVDVGEPTKEVLEELGYQVTWDLTADDAVTSAANHVFDVVLSDFSLPGSMNGLELGLRLRKEIPALPFLILTGYADQGMQAATEGFHVLYKPCPVDQLEITLRRIMALT